MKTRYDELDSITISKPGAHDKNDDEEETPKEDVSEPIPTAADTWHTLDTTKKTIEHRGGDIECYRQF